MRSANNLPDAKILLASYLNIRDLLGYDKVRPAAVKAAGCAGCVSGIGGGSHDELFMMSFAARW